MDKIRVLFVCYGNICRSPMAEFVFKDIIKKQGVEDKFIVESAATSSEELGNPVYYMTRKKLSSVGIDCSGKNARRINIDDYEKFDYIIGMESSNIDAMIRLFGDDSARKIYRLLDFTEKKGDIEDPWYTRNFDKVYEQILNGCKAFFESIM